jgi:hypothetical protein
VILSVAVADKVADWDSVAVKLTVAVSVALTDEVAVGVKERVAVGVLHADGDTVTVRVTDSVESMDVEGENEGDNDMDTVGVGLQE